MSTPEQNKAVIRRLVEEFWNKGQAHVVEEAMAAHIHDHDAPPGTPLGLEGYKQYLAVFQTAFSQTHTTIDDLVAEGDFVVWRWTFRGTHTGSLMGIPPTGKTAALSGITCDRFADGKIVERWGQADMVGLMQQLGVIPAPQAA